MRKSTAILFLLCAYLVLLVHNVVPHHHHDSIACFIIPVQEKHDSTCCTHHEDDHPNKHNSDDSNDDCLLNDVLAILPLQFKLEYHEYTIATKLIYSIQYLPGIKGSEPVQERSIPLIDLRHKPFLDFSYEYFATRCLGMRAPPHC